jgi:large subunit ribosomal protein L21
MAAEAGSRVELRDVLLITDGDKITVGAPTVADAVVVAEVVEHGKGRKVVNFKYKAKVRYRRKRGHRQGYTRLAVREIRLGDTPAAAAAEAPRRRAARPAAEAEVPAAEAEAVTATTETTAEAAPAPRRRRRTSESESQE